MFDYQLIPIIIFVVLLVPPILFAFFRGWKATLMISLVTFSIFGIIIGVSFAIYEGTIWPLFKGIFIKVHSSLDPNALSNSAKPTAIILVVGLSSPIVYGLTMCLYQPFKKILVKHLGPKTTNIDENTKKITRTSNIISRTTSIFIATTSSLLVSSTIASAASTVSTKYSKNNGFNKFLSVVGNIYTVGQGEYDESFMVLQDFIRNDLKAKEINALYELLDLTYKGIDPTYITPIKKKNIKWSIEKIANHGNTLVSFIKLIYSRGGVANKVDVLNDFEGINNGILGNPIEDGNYGTSLSERDAIGFHFSASLDAISVVEKYLRENRFVSFKKSKFFTEWKTSLNSIITLTNEVNNMKITLKNKKTEIESLKTEITNIGSSITLLTNRINDLGSEKTNGMLIDNALDKEEKAKNIMVVANNAYIGAHRLFKNNENRILEEKKSAVRELLKNYNDAKDGLKKFQHDSSKLASRISNYNAEIRRIENKISILSKNINSSVALQKKYENQITKATEDISLLGTSSQSLANSKERQRLSDIINIARFNVSKELSKQTDLRAELEESNNNKKSNMAKLKSAIAQKGVVDNDKIPAKKQEIHILLQDLNSKKSKRDKYIVSSWKPAKAIVDSKKNDLETKTIVHTMKLNKLNSLKNEKTDKEQLRTEKRKEKINKESMLHNAEKARDILQLRPPISQPDINDALSNDEKVKKFEEWIKANPQHTSIFGMENYITAIRSLSNFKKVIRNIKQKEYSILINKYIYVIKAVLKG